MFAPKSILVPSDFSEFSDRALQKAVDLAREYKSRIYLLHVIDEGLQQCVADYCLTDEVMKKMEANDRAASQNLLERQVGRIPDAAGLDISFDIRKGYPPDEIIKDQKEKNPDMIVIASHGRTGLLHNLLGSTTDKVLKNANCPVLLVRP
ncbi:MAG: universal stress protein [Syntrophaceae bacterium]